MNTLGTVILGLSEWMASQSEISANKTLSDPLNEISHRTRAETLTEVMTELNKRLEDIENE